MKVTAFVGQQFGRLTVIAVAPRRWGQRSWLCRCECGEERTNTDYHLRVGKVLSCGCLHREMAAASFIKARFKHGKSRTPEYFSWRSMQQRCNNPRASGFRRYGGRGIKVCERWSEFENFLADMGDRPDGTSLDRIDGTKGYAPGNCRWATMRVQSENRRSVVLIEFDGKRQSIADWAREKGMPITTLDYRLKHGWAVERALSAPVR